MLGEHMGKTNVQKALSLWHFGQATGIELPGEDPGLLRPVSKWSNSDLVSSVQGYSVMVTPLQLVRGMCAYANGGRLIQPRIVKGVLDENNSVVASVPSHPLNEMPEVIDPQTAKQMRRILADVPVRGTAMSARSQYWNLFGKTGTAHVATNKAYEDRYTASFIGGAPFENPRLVIAVILHDPDPSKVHFGGTVAAPAAQRILERCLAYLEVPASPEGSLQPPPPQIASLLYGYNPSVYRNKPVASVRD
jgi:stage V sporulation protein D (sporulation-specific penicillin-binding protein)